MRTIIRKYMELLIHGKDQIPRYEIEAEAHRLILHFGANAVAVAQQQVERAQWAKGTSDAPERTKRVLKAVRAKLRS